MKDKLLKLIKAKEDMKAQRKVEYAKDVENAKDSTELRSLFNQYNKDIATVDGEIKEYRDMLAEIEAAEKRDNDNIAGMPPEGGTPDGGKPEGKEPEGQPEDRGAGTPEGNFNPLGTYGVGNGTAGAQGKEDRSIKLKEESEKRGKQLMEGRSVTIASNVLLAQYTDTTLSKAFNQVSSLIDRVTTKPLIGGESYKKGYVKGYGTADYTDEGNDYNTTEPTFGYADINKTKVTSYAEDTEELLKLSAADYDAEVVNGVTIASRKKISREILVGDGTAGHLIGIFSSNATAIDSTTDISIDEINEDTLDDIIYGFGGDEDVEAASTLILNKRDLKAFSKLRDANGKKIYTIVNNGNTGTIDTIPFIINSACNAISNGATSGQYCMAYGPLTNYLLTIFSQMDVQRSTDYKFKQGMIANRSSVFVGGNVVSYNGFLRIKKK